MSPDDGAMVGELGADQIGVVVGERGTVWDEVDFEAANGIFRAIKPTQHESCRRARSEGIYELRM
jgi:hypothetical protein